MIRKAIEDLLTLSDISWGSYAFSRDPLNGKLTSQRRRELILDSLHCGTCAAQKLKMLYGCKNVDDYAKQLNIKVIYENTDGTDNYIVFARYNHPDQVTLYRGNTQKAEQLILTENLTDLLEEANVTSVLLAHELFHHIENMDSSIYTRTEKQLLWKIGPLKVQSRLIALGEIAAMAFARELLGLSYNPHIFDVILLYPHDIDKTQKLTNEILSFS